MKLKKISEISPVVTYKKATEGILLIDVREVDEVNEVAFDVKNILNIPLSVFEEQYQGIPKDQEVILVCRGGVRSMKAAQFLLEHGYTKMKNMKHGMIGWVKEGLPVINSATQEKTMTCGCCSSNKSQVSCCKTK